jgi:hypothetical protein
MTKRSPAPGKKHTHQKKKPQERKPKCTKQTKYQKSTPDLYKVTFAKTFKDGPDRVYRVMYTDKFRNNLKIGQVYLVAGVKKVIRLNREQFPVWLPCAVGAKGRKGRASSNR